MMKKKMPIHRVNKHLSSHNSRNRFKNKPLTSKMLRNARPFLQSRRTNNAKQISKLPSKLRYSVRKMKKSGHYKLQKKDS